MPPDDQEPNKNLGIPPIHSRHTPVRNQNTTKQNWELPQNNPGIPPDNKTRQQKPGNSPRSNPGIPPDNWNSPSTTQAYLRMKSKHNNTKLGIPPDQSRHTKIDNKNPGIPPGQIQAYPRKKKHTHTHTTGNSPSTIQAYPRITRIERTTWEYPQGNPGIPPGTKPDRHKLHESTVLFGKHFFKFYFRKNNVKRHAYGTQTNLMDDPRKKICSGSKQTKV
ncbi:uncharacterized protein LOC132557877 [Ylistrum balloti]|uniref:uncharacterized protein LOC132557877 n=1 Tax=Ylistrum balloti TaxID=509963 RepID=UPI002905D9DA|nr:uncharacterized protein LOC132557877 [Ylistrum balloti]